MTNYAGNRVNGGRILAHADVRMDSANFGGGTTTVVFAGAGEQTLDGAQPGRFPNKKVEKPSGVLHLAGAPQVFGNWEWVSAGALDAGTSVLTLATPYNTAVSITGGPVTYGDVIFKGWGQNSKHDLVGDFAVGGNLTLDMVAYSGNQLTGASFIVNGNVVMNNAGFGSASWGPGNSTIKLVGGGHHAIIANSSGHFPNIWIDTGSVETVGDVVVSGNWILANGTFAQGAGTVLEFQAPYAKTQTIVPGNATYGDVRIEGDGLSNQNVAGVLRCQNFTLSTRAYSGAKLNDGVVEVLGNFDLPGDGFGATDGGPGTALVRLVGSGTVSAGGLARCPSLEIAGTSATFIGGLRLGANYTHTSGTVVAAGSAQTFVGRQNSLVTGNAIFGDLTVHKGPLGSSYKVTLNGAVTASSGLTVTEGILEWAENASLSVAGNLSVGASNVGVVAGENSTLILNGSAAQNVNLAAKSVFNLSVSNVDAAVSFTGPYTAKGTTSAAPGSSLILASGLAFQTGKLSMNGTATEGIVLRASTEGTAANIVAAPYQFVRYADIKDMSASAGPKVVAVHSTDSGNNTNIVFQDEALLAISTGASSLTSPAWVEGVSGPDVTSLTVAVNGETPFDANRLNPTQWFAANNASGLALGVNLSAAEATSVEVTAQNDFGELATASQDIAWEATELAGKSYSTDQTKIRIGSKLRFVLNDGDGEAGEAVRIDIGNDGTNEYEGVEGDNFEHLFDAAGAVVVRGEVGGLLFGSITVIVVSTDLHPPVACHVDYERNQQVFTLPATEAANIAYAAADPYELGLTLTEVTSDGAKLKLKPTTMENPSFVSRLGAADGPIISIQPLTVFRIEHLNKNDFGLAVDDAGYGHGFVRYRIEPRTVIDNDNPVTPEQEGLFFHLQCSGASMVFAENGLSTLKVHSNRQDENGIFEAEVLLNPNATFVCNGIQAKQTNTPTDAVSAYTYSNPCVLKARGGLYLHREMSDETTREGKANLYPEGHAEAGKQIFQVWDQDVPLDMRWTAEIEAADFSPQALEAAFFAPKAQKPALPNRWFTVEVTQPSSFQYAVRMLPGTTGIRGGDSIEDNSGVNRDEILYQREPENQNYLKWESSGLPSAYPALNLPPNHWGLDYQDPAKLYLSWDKPFGRYSTSKFYTDIGFWKGNMIGKMTVWGTCEPGKADVERQAVRPNQRPGAPSNPHTNATDPVTELNWGLGEAEFRDILKFGRLEADGWRGEIDESGNTVFEDESSRDAFPVLVGANVYEVESVIQAPNPNDPGQTIPKTVTYLRTQHDGSTSNADPIPIQVTFRAPPGESVNVGVAIARRAERGDSQTLDSDGKKTHRAWLHLRNDAIFEYRGQPQDSEDVKAEKVYQIFSFDQNGDIEEEDKAERVVNFTLEAGEDWIASKVVYLYGIEASERLDDLKLVVWGEEVIDWKAKEVDAQAHHNQSSDLVEDRPIKRWYITDEEPFNVFGRPHRPGDYSVDQQGDDVEQSGQAWKATKYYYTVDPHPSKHKLAPTDPQIDFHTTVNDLYDLNLGTNLALLETEHNGSKTIEVKIDRFIQTGGVVVQEHIDNGVVSSTVRIRLMAEVLSQTSGTTISFNGSTVDANGNNMAIMPHTFGVPTPYEFSVPSTLLKTPLLKGSGGGRPTAASNQLTFNGGTYKIHWVEVSFDCISPYVLVHGKGADKHFWESVMRTLAAKRFVEALANRDKDISHLGILEGAYGGQPAITGASSPVFLGLDRLPEPYGFDPVDRRKRKQGLKKQPDGDLSQLTLTPPATAPQVTLPGGQTFDYGETVDHGRKVIGKAAGDGIGSTGLSDFVLGPAFDLKVRALGIRGWSIYQVMAGFEAFADGKFNDVRVINFSSSNWFIETRTVADVTLSKDDVKKLESAVRKVVKKKRIVVASAGNYNRLIQDTTPEVHFLSPQRLGIGLTPRKDKSGDTGELLVVVAGTSAPSSAGGVEGRYSKSSFGPEVNIAAPGANVPVVFDSTGAVGLSEGTSFSAPLVSGVISQMFTIDPDLEDLPRKAIEIVEATADNIGLAANEMGHGRVNFWKAALVAANGHLPSQPGRAAANEHPIFKDLAVKDDDSTEVKYYGLEVRTTALGATLWIEDAAGLNAISDNGGPIVPNVPAFTGLAQANAKHAVTYLGVPKDPTKAFIPYGRSALTAANVDYAALVTLSRDCFGAGKQLKVYSKGVDPNAAGAPAPIIAIPLDPEEMKKAGASGNAAIQTHVKSFDDFVFVIGE